MTNPAGFVRSVSFSTTRSLRSNTVIPSNNVTPKVRPSAAKKMQNDDSDYEADKEQGKNFEHSQLNESSQSDDSSEAKKNSQSAKLSHDNDTEPKKRKYLEDSVTDTQDSIANKVFSAFQKSLNVLEKISKLVSNSEEETTEQESSDANHKRFVRFLEPINPDEVDYKIYIKGLSSQSGTRYGVSIKKLDSASKKRKGWPDTMKKADTDISLTRKEDKYYMHPSEVTGHYSHALPNCFYGTETPANAACATRANFSSRFTGQGDAQGIIEEALRGIYEKKVEVDTKTKGNPKSPDLRWKSSDAFSKDGQLIYRRIKIYASDTYGAISNDDGRYNYAEIMLGEFFLPGHLAVSKKSSLIKELETKVSKMQNNFNDLINVYQKNISKGRDTKFWRKNSFIARGIEFDGIKQDTRSHIIDAPAKFPQEYYDLLTKLNPVELQEEMSSIAEVHKKNRDDVLFEPRMIKTSKTETLDDVIDEICNKLKKTDFNTLNDLRSKHQKLFNDLEASNNSEGESPDMQDNKVKIDVDVQTLKNCHSFFSDLISEKLVKNNDIKLLANKMMLPKTGNSLYVNHTPITAWVFAILRIAKKIKK